jgi:hypothetical protein
VRLLDQGTRGGDYVRRFARVDFKPAIARDVRVLESRPEQVQHRDSLSQSVVLAPARPAFA